MNKRQGFICASLAAGLMAMTIGAAIISGVWRWGDRDVSVSAPAYQWRSTSCWFDADYQRDIICGHLQVRAAGGEFLLPVVIIKEESLERRPDPVIYLNGGPGVSIGLHQAGIQKWLAWLRVADLKRDLILMDGRGLGQALPAVNCAALAQFNRDLLREPLPLAEERSRNRELVRDCLLTLKQQHPVLDSQNFGSVQSAKDLIGLMQTLAPQYEYPSFNILAVSYGTRLALEVERLGASLASNPLRAMVLDSVYPAGEGGIATLPDVAGAAFTNFFDGCSRQSSCADEFALISGSTNPTAAEIEQWFLRALDTLANRPAALVLRPHEDELAVNFSLTDARFLAASFARSYSVSAWPDIARATRAVLEGDDASLKLFVSLFLRNTFNPDYNELAFILTDCRDNALGDALAFAQAQARYPAFAHFFSEDLAQQTCQDFDALTPLSPNPKPLVPTLVIGGEDDPITPISWAQALNKRWHNPWFVQVAKQGHAVLGEDVCWLESVGVFFDAADHRQLDLSEANTTRFNPSRHWAECRFNSGGI